MALFTDSEKLQRLWPGIRTAIYVISSLLLFLFALALMLSSLHQLGQSTAETILVATANPFTGLFIGLLITAMIQSSSTTTAMVVALVASGSITLESAVPLIMGANIGTTITSTIVALGFISKKKEFGRAVSAGTFHDLFNILTVLILFPLEYYYNFLSGLSSFIVNYFFASTSLLSNGDANTFSLGIEGFAYDIVHLMPNAFVGVFIAFCLLFGSILIFRKLISNLLLEHSPERVGSFFFQSPFKSFAWGLGITATIRSSTITTSLVVPLVAKRIIRLKQAAPFIIGANIGTTVTAIIASILYSNTLSAITIALVHFLFNIIGALVFLLVPFLKRLPQNLAQALGRLTQRHRLTGFVYLLSTFFIIPFSLIYFNRDSIETTIALYSTTTLSTNTITTTKLVSRINRATNTGQWIEVDIADSTLIAPRKIQSIQIRNNVLFVDGEVYMFTKPGFCWDEEDKIGKYKVCIDSILHSFQINKLQTIDSVYVYTVKYYSDSTHQSKKIYFNPQIPLLIKEMTIDSSGVVHEKKIINIQKN